MSAQFTVTDSRAPGRAAEPMVRAVAKIVRDDAAASTPRRTGRLAAGWQISKQGVGRWRVSNSVSYGRFVEYGSRRNTAVGMFGRAVARARARYGS